MSEFTPLWTCCCDEGGDPDPPPPACCPCYNLQTSYVVTWTGSATYEAAPSVCPYATACGYAIPLNVIGVLRQTVVLSPFSLIATWQPSSICQLSVVQPPRPFGNRVVANYDNDGICYETSTSVRFRPFFQVTLSPPRGSGCTQNGQPLPAIPYWEAKLLMTGIGPGAGGGTGTELTFRKDGYSCIPGDFYLHSVVGPLSANGCVEMQQTLLAGYNINVGTLRVT